MQLTDQQIMLLEQLTYLNDGVAEAAGVRLGAYQSVERLLQEFDEAALQRLEQSDKTLNGEIDGKEWAAIIRAIKNDEQLYSMNIADRNEDVKAICFTEPGSEGEAIVAFRGTSGQREWEDNSDGLYSADTECQKEALAYIESLPYDDITVTGHSKGGNKAQYVTILSDKVNRCVSMDGQGFSPEFLNKYYAEIERKGGCIVNYYLEGDFVNILLFPVPGSDRICIVRRDDVTGAKNHSPGAFYEYYMNEQGQWVIKYDDDGQTELVLGQQAQSMVYLHEFICFVLNVMPYEDRKEISDYIGKLMALALTNNGVVEVNGVTYTKDNIMEYLMSEPKLLGRFLAYFIKYAETYELTEEEIRDLAEVMGLEEFLDMLDTAYEENWTVRVMIDNAGGIFNFIVKQLGDGKEDKIIGMLLDWLSSWLNDKGIKVDAREIWKNIESEYTDIPAFNGKTARNDGTCKSTVTRDFSKSTYDRLMGTIDAVEAMTYGSVSGWSGYASEEWYSSLMISSAVRGITTYFNKVSQINQQSKNKITEVFENALAEDRASACELKEINEELHTITDKIIEMAEKLS